MASEIPTNWKERVAFYSGINWNETGSNMHPILVAEAVVPVIEPALQALSISPYELSIQDFVKMLGHIAVKPSISNLVFYISELKFKQEYVPSLIEHIQQQKVPKTIVRCVELLRKFIKRCGEFEEYELAIFLLSHPDKSVRNSGVDLICTCHNLVGDSVFEYLKDIKPILIREIEAKIKNGNAVLIPVPNTDCSATLVDDIQPSQQSTPVDSLNLSAISRVPGPNTEHMQGRRRSSSSAEYVRGFEKLSSNDWKIRVDALNEMIENGVPHSLNSLVVSKIRDPNLQVVQAALRLLPLIDHSDSLASVILKLKDKKLTEKIKPVLPLFQIQDILKHLLAVDTATQKLALIEHLTERVETESKLIDYTLLNPFLEDPSESVRNACVVLFNLLISKGIDIDLNMVSLKARVLIERGVSNFKKPNSDSYLVDPESKRDMSLSNTERSLTVEIVDTPVFPKGNILLPAQPAFRVKNGKHSERVFTPGFIDFMNSSDPAIVMHAFRELDSLLITDFVLAYITCRSMSESLEGYIEYLIEKEYILKEQEARIITEFCSKNELSDISHRLERIYPRSKLALMFVDRSFSNLSINSPQKKRSKTRTELEKIFSEKCPSANFDAQYALLDDKVDMGIDGTGHLKPETILKSEIASKISLNSGVREYDSNKLFIESDILPESSPGTDIFDESIGGIKPVELRQQLDFNKFEIERMLLDLIDSDRGISRSAFCNLNSLAKNNPDVIVFSANSIVSSILIQLNDLDNSEESMVIYILDTLYILLKKEFVEELSIECLVSMHRDLIALFLNRNSHTEIVRTILLTIESNVGVCRLLNVYLSLLSLHGSNEYAVKLIEHNSSRFNKSEDVQGILTIFSKFFSTKEFHLLIKDAHVRRSIQIHLQELVKFHDKSILNFQMSEIVAKYITGILGRLKAV